MTATNSISSDNVNKYFEEKARGISKVRLSKESKLYFTKGTKERGGRGLGRFHEIVEAFIDNDNRVFVGFRTRDESSLFRQYAVIGRLLTSEEEAA